MTDINVSFFCVQPIRLSDDLNNKLLLKKVPFSKVDKYTKRALDKKNGWYKHYNKLYDAYRTLQEVQLDEISIDLLKTDLTKDCYSPKNHKNESLALAKYLDAEKTSYTLFFDTRFSYFILVYEIFFIFPKKVLEDFLHYDDPSVFDDLDLYNAIRNLIVKDTSDSFLSSWGRSIRNEAINKTKSIISDAYQTRFLNKEVSISNSSCNISCLIMETDGNDSCLVSKFNNLNRHAERLTSHDEIEGFYGDTVFYSFNGRFHTIYLKNQKDELRFQPLQFHVQFMWYLVKRYNQLMNKMNLELMQNSSTKNLKKYADTIHILINKIEFLSLHDSNFKHSIEIDYQNIYINNEKKWSVDSSLSSSKQYITFFKDYLERLFNQKNERFQKRQNGILLLISTLQLVALLSVWGDYLQLLKNKGTGLDQRLLSIFQTTQNFMTFNYYLPIFLFISIAVVLIYLFIRKKD